MMLKANELAAETTLKNCPSCAVLRRHPPPKFHALEELNNELKKINEKLDQSNSYNLNKSLDLLFQRSQIKNSTFKILITRCMHEAQYISSFDSIMRSDLHH